MAKLNSVDSVQASGEVSHAMDEMKSFACNRQLAAEEMERERTEYPGWIAARSLDGSQTYAYARNVDEMRAELLLRGMRICDVVLDAIEADAIEGDAIDADGCRL